MLIRLTPNAPVFSMGNMSHSSTTFSAVIRSSNDRRVVLAESVDWHTKRDAEILGVAELARGGWTRLESGVLCIEERS